MVEEGQRDPEFETILDSVDPNRYERRFQLVTSSWKEPVILDNCCDALFLTWDIWVPKHKVGAV